VSQQQRPWEEWAQWDETVEERVVTEAPHEAKAWLGGQRFVHGLLRSLHTADASAREARVRSILEAVERERAGPVVLRWQWFAAAALLALSALLAFQLWGGEAALPKAEAMVGRAAERLAQPMDRRYALSIEESGRGRGARVRRHDYTITMRPGRFLLEGDGLLGTIRAGSDGEELWFEPGVSWGKRVAVPIEEASRLDESLGDVIAQGVLDLDTFVERLPGRAELRTSGRIRGDGDAPDLVRVDILRLGARRAEWRVREAFLLMEEETGEVTQAVLRLVRPWVPGRPRRHVAIELTFEETIDLGEDAYRRPW